MSRLCRIVQIGVILKILCVVLVAQGRAETLTLEQFMEQHEKWPEWEEQETTLTIQGRFEAGATRWVRLRKCPLRFEAAGADFPRFDRHVENLQIEGRIAREIDEQYFRVFSLKRLPSDAETLAVKKAAVDPSRPAHWYALADWAGQRGAFYDDKYLLAQAAEARQKGFLVERDRAKDSPAALMKLANTVRKSGDEAFARQLIHQALQLQLSEENAKSADQQKALVETVRKEFPGADQPLADWPEELAKAYAETPVATYDQAAEADRRQLERILYATLILEGIEDEAQPDGRDGDAIAARIEAALPDRSLIANQYRLRAIEYAMAHLETATRADVLALAEKLRARQRPVDASEVIRKWLRFRETAAEGEGAATWIAIADDYVALLDDSAGAGRVWRSALDQSPDSKEIPKRLEQLGYRKVKEDWLSPEEVAARPLTEIESAMRDGRVTIGMDRGQVLKTLGEPERAARSASRTLILTTWFYGTNSGLAIRFERKRLSNSATDRVVAIDRVTVAY